MEEYIVTPFVVGSCESPEARLLYLGDTKKTLSTIFSFFLLRGEERLVLIDVGFTADYCKQYMPDVVQEKNQNPISQLKEQGIEPNEIDDIIITHAHFDHLSDVINIFSKARIHLQRIEYDFVINPPHPWFQEMVDIVLIKELAEQGIPRFNLIDGECEILPGIKIIMTPGHTHGHQSVIVKTKAGEVCITGDSILNYRNIKEDIGPGFNSNLIESLQSIQKLRELSDEGMTILCGHDPEMLNYIEKLNA